MARRTGVVAALAVVGALVLGMLASFAVAESGSGKFKAKRMVASFEVPAASSDAEGRFEATLQGSTIEYTLRYSGLESSVAQAHIHFAQPFASGGISAWLCETATVQSPQAAFNTICPQSGEVTGTISAAQVIGPGGQGISAGEFAELVEAMRAGFTYANVHSASIPGGEIRGQIRNGGDGGDNDD